MKYSHLIGIALLLGCSVPTKSRTVRAIDLQYPERTTITGLMEGATSGITEARDLPNGVPAAAVLDAAHIVSSQRGWVCLGVRLKTHVSRDVPLSEAEFILNGARVYADAEEVQVRDFDFESRQEIVAADWVGVGRFSISQGTDRVFRTYVRRGRVCGAAASNKVKLEITLPTYQPGDETFGQAFQWVIH